MGSDTLYQLRGRVSLTEWEQIGAWPECDKAPAIALANRLCDERRYIRIEVRDLTTNQIVHAALCRPIG